MPQQVKKRAGLTAQPAKTNISTLGKELLKLRERYIASGGELLNRRELELELADRRGGR